MCYVASSEAEMMAFRARAKDAKMQVMRVADRGPPEAIAVLAVGPVPIAELAALVNGLKMM